MPDYRRFRLEGGTYLFTVVTFQRRPILTTEVARRLLHLSWVETQNQFPFKTIAVCLMPDHIHCLWKLPEGDADYSTRWNRIKGFFSKKYLKEVGKVAELSSLQSKRREAGIWQRRFWEHTIQDGDDLDAHLDYIHYNPVKHGFVDKPVDWKWSSIHRFIQNGFYDNKWVGGDEGKLKLLDLE